MGPEDTTPETPRRLVVDIADRDAELRRAAEERQRYYRKVEAEAAQKTQAAAKQAGRTMEWAEQGDEIKRLNSRALAVIASEIDCGAIGEAFDAAIGRLGKCSAIARSWAAEARQCGGAEDVDRLAGIAADESQPPEAREAARARLADLAKR